MDRAELIRQCTLMRIELEDIQDADDMIDVAIHFSFKTDAQLDFELIWLEEVLGK